MTQATHPRGASVCLPLPCCFHLRLCEVWYLIQKVFVLLGFRFMPCERGAVFNFLTVCVFVFVVLPFFFSFSFLVVFIAEWLL